MKMDDEMNKKVEQAKELLMKAKNFYKNLCQTPTSYGIDKKRFDICYQGWNVFIYLGRNRNLTWSITTTKENVEYVRKRLQNSGTKPLYEAQIPGDLVEVK